MRRPSPTWLGLALISGMAAIAWPYTVDDAFVVARYAERIAEGEGYTFNSGPATDGVTAPLWLVPITLGVLAGLPTIVLQKVLGILATLLAVALALRDVAGRFGGVRAAWVGAMVVGVQTSLGIWSVAGLETGLATLCFTILALSALGRPRPNGVVAGLAAGALLWIRPECAVVAVLLVVAASVRDREKAAVPAVIFLASLVAVVAFRWLAFGDPLPLAFHAKPGHIVQGFGYVGRGLLVITGMVGAAVAAYGAYRGTLTDRLLGAALLAHLGAVALAGGDWMPGFRLLAPVLPAYATLVGLGIARIPKSDIWTALGLTAASVWVPALDVGAELPRAIAAGRFQNDTGSELAAYLERYDTVAMVDVGYLGWKSGVEVVDLGGITDPFVARAPGGHLAKEISTGYLDEREPDALVLHSSAPPVVDESGRLVGLTGYPVEMRLAASGWGQRFRAVRIVHYAPGYYYVVLEAP